MGTAWKVTPGSVALPADELKEHIKEFQQATGVIIYCTRGIYSETAVENPRERSVNAYSLRGGYMGWNSLINHVSSEKAVSA